MSLTDEELKALAREELRREFFKLRAAKIKLWKSGRVKDAR